MIKTFKKYIMIAKIIFGLMPTSIRMFKERINPRKPLAQDEYWLRIIDNTSRKVINEKFNTMSEIVNHVYHDKCPTDNKKYYLVRKNSQVENIIELKASAEYEQN
jgi:hypothetical protein